ncbi:MAG: hypothetical protein ABR599_11755 [Gemmatimonadota bacterium]
MRWLSPRHAPLPGRRARGGPPLLVLWLVSTAVAACAGDAGDGRAVEARSGVPQPVAAAGDGAATTQRRDATVLAIFAELREDSLTRGRDVSIGAAGTSLVLKGRVADAAIRERALAIAREHAGSFTLLDSLVVTNDDRGGEP